LPIIFCFRGRPDNFAHLYLKEENRTMAKSKKPTPKAAKKPAAKAKPAAKVKKAAPAKAKKAAPKKAVAVKKVAPKKVIKKPVAVKKEVVAKKEAPKKVEKVEKIVPKKAEREAPVAAKTTPVTQKPAPPQLTIFPVPNQRPIAHKPAKASSTEDRTRYSDDELKEFESLINRKLDKAREEYKILKDTLNRNNDEGTDATSGGNTKVLEDGAETAEKENLSQLAARQQKYITNLENALIRIKNGTYGICSVTGKLISKERLIAVPHTTQSIEAKMMQQD
jgi:RNA polymerase-binding transcription factor DksA